MYHPAPDVACPAPLDFNAPVRTESVADALVSEPVLWRGIARARARIAARRAWAARPDGQGNPGVLVRPDVLRCFEFGQARME